MNREHAPVVIIVKKKEITHRKGQMKSDQEDRESELEGVVQVVIVDDDRGAEDDPDGYDGSRGQLVFRRGWSCGGRGESRLGGCSLLVLHVEHLWALLAGQGPFFVVHLVAWPRRHGGYWLRCRKESIRDVVKDSYVTKKGGKVVKRDGGDRSGRSGQSDASDADV